MRLLFIGSGALACPALEAVLARPHDSLVGVVTQPDRPSGRHLRPKPCPVKTLLDARGIPCLTPEKAGHPDVIAQLAAGRPDLIIVAAYGQMLKPALLETAPLGAINVHPSLLPRYRGAAPIQWSLIRGETVTGVTILHVTAKMDAGDLILVEETPVLEDDTSATLEPRLAGLGARLLDRALDLIAVGAAPRHPQDEALVTFAPKLKKEDGILDWRRPAVELRNRIRGLNPWPCCFTRLPGEPGLTVKILSARVEAGSGTPGRVIGGGTDGPLVATGEGTLRLLSVKPEGKAAMSGAAFWCGHRQLEGSTLG